VKSINLYNRHSR